MRLVLRLVLAVVIALGGFLPCSASTSVETTRDHRSTGVAHSPRYSGVAVSADPCHAAPKKSVDHAHCVTVSGTCCALELPATSTATPDFATTSVVWRVHTDVAVVAWTFEPATPPPRI